MTITPINDQVVVKPLPLTEKSGELWLPEKRNEPRTFLRAEVIGIAKGNKFNLFIGQIIAINWQGGREFHLINDEGVSEQHLLLTENEILGTCEEVA